MPGSKGVHVDQPLTNVSVAYIQEQTDFIASMAFPEINVRHKSDTYRQWSKGSFMRDEAKERAGCTESVGGTRSSTQSPYKCKVYAFHEDVCWQDIANADDGVNPEQEASRNVTQKMLIKRERQFALDYFKAGVWTTDYAVTTPWDNAAGTPIKDLRSQIRLVKKSTGFKPNRLVLDGDTFDALVDSADFLGRVNGGATVGQPAQVNQMLLANILGLDMVLVSEASYVTSKEGVSPEVGDSIMPNGALLLYAPDSPGMYTPSAGYTFNWAEYIGDNGQEISRFDMDHLKATRVEGEIAFDQNQVAADLGVFFTGVLT